VSIFVKICGIRDAEAAAAAVEAGADAVGFVFADSVRRVEPAAARTIAAGVPQGVRKVAVMRHPSRREWQAVLEEFGPDVLQTDASDFAKLDVPDSIARWPVRRESDGLATMPPSQVYVYEGAQSGTGTTVDWTIAARLARSGRMILAGGLTPANVATAIATVRPWGVDVSSGVESAPGHKDPGLIRDFIGAVRGAEQRA